MPTTRTAPTTVINPLLTRIIGRSATTMHTACRRTSGGRCVVWPRAVGAYYHLIIVDRVVRGDGCASLIIPRPRCPCA